MAGEQPTSTITVVDVYNVYDPRQCLRRNMHCFFGEIRSIERAVKLALAQGRITAFSWYWDTDGVFVVTAGVEPNPSLTEISFEKPEEHVVEAQAILAP